MYHELVFHVDLSILAYHQHAQTLIWPFDPYYERLAMKGSSRRDNFMAEVRSHFNGNANYHGPGNTHGWVLQGNPALDPIMSRYDRLYPWLPAFTEAEPGKWTLYQVPPYIADRIATVHMCSYNAGGAGPDGLAAPATTLTQVAQNPQGGLGGARTDRLFCFEGGTGRIINTPSNMSLMGCILDRQTPAGYDVHIAFRGSRSGSGGRAMGQGLVSKGNPDWVTDMDFNTVVQDNEFSTYGSVCRGFSRSVKTMLPAIIACLQQIHNLRGAAPQNIWVTGHSLGGALATQFTTAMTLGTTRGPMGANLGPQLSTWPWANIRLISVSAPVAGGKSFHKHFNSKIWCRRIVLSEDPITQEKRHYHVGSEVLITGENTLNILSYHEPANVRDRLIRKITQWGDNLANIPSPQRTDGGFPFKYFDSFNAMYTATPELQVPANLRRLLTGIDTDVQTHFIPILATILANSSSYKTTIMNRTILARNAALQQAGNSIGWTLRSGASNANAIRAQFQHGVRTLRQTFDGDLGKHISFALVLAEIAHNVRATWPILYADPYVQEFVQ